MQILSGKIQSALKVVVYGPEGIGKSTFAAQFPRPVFIDTESSTVHMDVRRTPRPASWPELLEQVQYFIFNPDELGTLVIDTADWAEILCVETVCARDQKKGIEDFGYGKGYIYLAEEFGRLLNLLEVLKDKGVNTVVTAHAKMRKFEQPDELGAYDRWEMKLSKQCAPMMKEWADMVLFARHKTYVVNVDGQGAQKGKNKAQGGSRVMQTVHHPCWDAKNRFALPEELPFDYAHIAHLIKDMRAKEGSSVVSAQPDTAANPPAQAPSVPPPTTKSEQVDPAPESDDTYAGIPIPLARLMKENDVLPGEIIYAVSQRGYYPAATPIGNYDPDFVSGVLVGAWDKVFQMVKDNRNDTPF